MAVTTYLSPAFVPPGTKALPLDFNMLALGRTELIIAVEMMCVLRIPFRHHQMFVVEKESSADDALLISSSDSKPFDRCAGISDTLLCTRLRCEKDQEDQRHELRIPYMPWNLFLN